MADDRSRKLTGAVPAVGGVPTPVPGQIAREPRAAVTVPVRYRYQSFVDFIETQSMNISRSGMFIASKASVPIGTGPRGHTAISPGVEFNGRDLHVEINPGTAPYFTQNPLLNIRLGGFVVPAPEDVPLGTMFAVTIYDVQRAVLWNGRGKVVAKHEARLGIRLSEVPKDVLARLQAEV